MKVILLLLLIFKQNWEVVELVEGGGRSCRGEVVELVGGGRVVGGVGSKKFA